MRSSVEPSATVGSIFSEFPPAGSAAGNFSSSTQIRAIPGLIHAALPRPCIKFPTFFGREFFSTAQGIGLGTAGNSSGGARNLALSGTKEARKYRRSERRAGQVGQRYFAGGTSVSNRASIAIIRGEAWIASAVVRATS